EDFAKAALSHACKRTSDYRQCWWLLGVPVQSRVTRNSPRKPLQLGPGSAPGKPPHDMHYKRAGCCDEIKEQPRTRRGRSNGNVGETDSKITWGPSVSGPIAANTRVTALEGRGKDNSKRAAYTALACRLPDHVPAVRTVFATSVILFLS